jgi:hypothetical protein
LPREGVGCNCSSRLASLSDKISIAQNCMSRVNDSYPSSVSLGTGSSP